MRTILPAILFFIVGVAVLAQDAFEWRDDFETVDAWDAQPGWLGNPSPTAKATAANGIASFSVDEPGKGMKWRRDLPNVWLPEQRFLVVRYRAKNMNTGIDGYFIYLDDSGQGPECHPIRLKDIKGDSEWRTVVVDVLPIANGESVRGMAVQVQASDEGKAEVQMDYVAFADRIPEGAEELSGQGFAAKPDASIPIAQANWTAQPSWLSNPAKEPEVIREKEITIFRAKEPNRGMKWSWDLPEPTDLAGHRYVALRYRAQNIKGMADYAVCVMGRLAAEGGHSYTSAVPLSALVSDGRWHNLTVDAMVPAKTIPKVAGLAVQVQAANDSAAELAIAEIRFTNEIVPDHGPGGRLRCRGIQGIPSD